MSDTSAFKLDSMLTFIPEGHEKPLKQAFYNVAAILFVIMACAAAVAVYYIMEPFFSPLIWAVLFGSVLHPIKQSFTNVVKTWLTGLQGTGTPVCLGIATFPIMIVDRVSENILFLLAQFWKIILAAAAAGVLGGVLLYILPYNLIFNFLILIGNVIMALASGIMSCLSIYLVVTIVLSYLIVVLFFWTAEFRPLVQKLALPVWLVLLLYLAAIAGPFRMPLFCLLVALVFIGCLTQLNKDECHQMEEVDGECEIGFVKKLKHNLWEVFNPESNESHGQANSEGEEEEDEKDGNFESHDCEEKISKRKLNMKLKLSEQKLSNIYITGLFFICVIVQLWLHLTKILSVVLLISVYILLKYLGYQLGLWSFMSSKSNKAGGCWLGERKDALLPGPIRGVWTLVLKGDAKCMEYMDGAIDETISLIVILLMFIFAICATIFLFIQIYTESVHLVDLTSNLINRTIVHNPEIQEMLPAGLGEEIQTTINSAMDNAYHYGRNYTVSAVSILKFYLKLHYCFSSLPSNAECEYSLVEGLKKPGVLNLSFISEFAKENLGTLMSVMDSLWVVLRGNFSLIINLVTAIFSVLLVGGTAVLNFFVNSIIFFTALVYLLCASSTQYKPVQLAGNMLPSNGGAALGEAFNEAVNSVFAATFKRALFYGMYTWLIHTVLAVQMVYIPSVLAAVLGAVPVLGTYWACFPAIIELGLVNGDMISAIVMLVLSFVPMSFVDSAINAEIKSGHPYLTALAIAGGVFCLGMEGALIGPILLCLLSVVFKMYGAFMSEQSPNVQKGFPLKR
ncbi:Transmembrane protein 245 [Nymphon striatum]|nr:Transmembrane protein 245 [Nymphon striatum]